MKRFALGTALFFAFIAGLFAQVELTPLVVVKVNRSETVTLKQLKERVEMYQKQTGTQNFTPEQKEEILNAIVDEKLVVQAAQKAGISLTDTQVNQYFLQSLSQQVGRQVTEAEFADIVKKQTGQSLDDFMKQQIGLTTAGYKAYLKNQLLAQQYVLQQKQADIQKVVATDAEIKSFYEVNKASFSQNDMLKLFLVIVPKGSDANAAKTKANKMLNDLKDKKTTCDKLKSGSSEAAGYQGGDLLIAKTAQHAQQLGIGINDLMELFGYDINYVSELNETPNDFQFYQIRQKYPAKMLGILDVVQPESTVTVYDYIRQNLTQQKQSQAMIQAVNEITTSLNTKENVDWKKTGDDLKKLLNW